jgi:hypothetical protein
MGEKVLICNNCKRYWVAPKYKCDCGSTTLTVTHPMNIIHAVYSAIIVNTKGWKDHWFEGKDGTELIVKKYPYKSTKGGQVEYCYCFDCLKNRRGKKLYETYEVVSGYKNTGSIIPECCLSFVP